MRRANSIDSSASPSDWASKDVIGLMDVSLTGGVLKGDRLMEFFRRGFQDRDIDALRVPFAAVATSLRTGAEVWLRQGSTLDAVPICEPNARPPEKKTAALGGRGGGNRTASVNPTQVRSSCQVVDAERRQAYELAD